MSGGPSPRDLRRRLAAARARSAPLPAATPPAPDVAAPLAGAPLAGSAELLAVLPRGASEEVRVVWDAVQGYRFLEVRRWKRGPDGEWYPDSGRPLRIPAAELARFADAVSVAAARATIRGRA